MAHLGGKYSDSTDFSTFSLSFNMAHLGAIETGIYTTDV